MDDNILLSGDKIVLTHSLDSAAQENGERYSRIYEDKIEKSALGIWEMQRKKF